MWRSVKVAVIGGGVSGLIAARELTREGHRVVVYEKQSRIGGTWLYSPEIESDPLGPINPETNIVHSSLYYSLRTNLPRELMSFSDYPFVVSEDEDSDSRKFPRHEEVLKYLEGFVEEFGLVELIKFNEKVVRVEQQQVDDDDDKWIVESESRNGELKSRAEEMFDAVVVCNGHYTHPRLANLPGIEKWPGKQIHSHNYRIPEPFQNQVVVVIGGGPSAGDISREIATVAKQVYLSLKPTDNTVLKPSFHPDIHQHSMIEFVHEDGLVSFQDGFSVHADVILHCTGFKYNISFLKTNGIVTIDDNRVGPLYKHIFPPQLAPTLGFVGLPSRGILFRIFELQSKWIACVLSGKVLLPSKEKMLDDVEHHYKQMKELGIPKPQTHFLNPLRFEYLDWLASQVGCSPVEDQVKDMSRQLYMILLSGKYDSLRDE